MSPAPYHTSTSSRGLFVWLAVAAFLFSGRALAQTFPFTSGAIPLCDTTEFTANVSGVGVLIYPDPWSWGSFLENVLINITTDHPQTLQISLTSPEGTTLLLSEFNGAGGQNYTNTNFNFWGWNDITTASAPFSGSYFPQDYWQTGGFENFTGENANGIWTLTVIDTSCVNGGTGPNGTWTPGWLNGSSGSGAIAFGTSSPPPPCEFYMGSVSTTICPGGTADVLSEFEAQYGFNWFDVYGPTWNWVGDPYAVTEEGYYQIIGYDGFCTYWGEYNVTFGGGVDLGPDLAISQCDASGPADLTALFPPPGTNTYSWTYNGSPISSAIAASTYGSGVYTLTSSEGGCSDVVEIDLTIGSGPDLGPDVDESICAGESIDLTNFFPAAGPNAYWSYNGMPFASPTAATAAGSYMVEDMGPNGCLGQANLTLTVDAQPALGADQQMDLCANSSLDLEPLYDVTGFSANWSLNAVPIPNPSNVVTPGTYQLVAMGAPGCSDTALVTVQGLVAPDLGDDAWIVGCVGEEVDLMTVFNTSGLNTNWTASGMPVSDPSNVTSSDLYTLVATNVDGCSDTADVDVFLAPSPVLGPDQTLNVCANEPVDLTTLYATGADATEWTLNGQLVMDPSSVTEAGTFVLDVTNVAGCSATAGVTIVHQPTPSIGPDQSATICSGETIDLTSSYTTTGLTATWTLDGAPVADPTSVGNDGSYQLVVTNGAGCTDTAQFVLTTISLPAFNTQQFFSLCPWQTVDLTALLPFAGLSFTYTLNGAVVEDPTTVTDEGEYLITVENSSGCIAEVPITVVAIECLCEADFSENAKCVQDPVQFILEADSAVVGVQWSFHGAAPDHWMLDPLVLFETTEEEVLVTMDVELSCGSVQVERIVRVPDCSDSCSVFVPNVFTPDADGVNDAWRWSGDCQPEDFAVEVFNRWGEQVFATKDPFGKWDGTYGGTVSQDGVYVYRMSYRLPYQDRKEVMGTVTLLR